MNNWNFIQTALTHELNLTDGQRAFRTGKTVLSILSAYDCIQPYEKLTVSSMRAILQVLKAITLGGLVA